MAEESSIAPPENSPRPTRWRAPVVILFLQTFLMLVVTAWFFFELLTDNPDSFSSAVALFVLIVLGTVWVAATAVGLLRSASWARGSAVTIQILQIAVAIGSFQGQFAQPLIGWILLLSAVVALILLVRAAKRQSTATGDDVS
ncbi:hypothetical protein [Lysinibacter sp. HNR]|uniref:hypothetical protein n=1 Tax=Lysinibacter sp. HNR TaxID=3031408 RepID=UPI0024353EFF|nr:hypothetical protein [Lysinibacter sp. HNR]WGD36940.1 hypothetical protein FrondiHNR_10875 [Lysinibacter sp. HNR]